MRTIPAPDKSNRNFMPPAGASGERKRVSSSHLIERVILPQRPAGGEESFEADVYNRFMRNLRQVPNSRLEIKILSAIQFTADLVDHGDALIAKTLVDMGLRAPRQAFPLSFLDFADKSLARRQWDIGSCPPSSVLSLRRHWDSIGEERTAQIAPNFEMFSAGPYARA
jgi:hypothetical protein